MWSETISISMINLQTLKSILKSAQKCVILLLKFKKKFWGGAWPPPQTSPLGVPSIRPL